MRYDPRYVSRKRLAHLALREREPGSSEDPHEEAGFGHLNRRLVEWLVSHPTRMRGVLVMATARHGCAGCRALFREFLARVESGHQRQARRAYAKQRPWRPLRW